MLLLIVSIKKTILFITSQWVKKRSWDSEYNSKRLLKPELPSQGSINMVEMLSLGFEQCFGSFTMLLFGEIF